MSTHNNTRAALIARMRTLEAQVSELTACSNSARFTTVGAEEITFGEIVVKTHDEEDLLITSLQDVFPNLQGKFKNNITCKWYSRPNSRLYCLYGAHNNPFLWINIDLSVGQEHIPSVVYVLDKDWSRRKIVSNLDALKGHLAPFCDFT